MKKRSFFRAHAIRAPDQLYRTSEELTREQKQTKTLNEAYSLEMQAQSYNLNEELGNRRLPGHRRCSISQDIDK